MIDSSNMRLGRTAVRYAVAGAGVMCASWLAIGVAMAQSTSATGAPQSPAAEAAAPAGAPSVASPDVQEVVVTGSRIRSANARSASPITVVTAADISKTKATTVEEILQKIPAADFTGGITANSNNGGVGASEVGLKNLGPARTLVLVNGYRFPATDTEGSTVAVDLNNVPVSMIDHVDVLRQGASAIYGADAIAGVINIVTKKNAAGATIDTNIGGAGDGGGLTYGAHATLGANFDRGNILINIGTDHRDDIAQSDRLWSKNQFIGTSSEGNGPISSKLPVFTGKVGGQGDNIAFLANHQQVSLSDPNSANLIPNTLFFPQLGRSYYDLSSQPALVGGLERKQLNLTGHYDLTPDVTVVLEGFYTDRTSSEQLNPDPLSSTITTNIYPGLMIPANLPDKTPNTQNYTGQDITSANFRPFGGGNRLYREETNTYRFRGGLEGTINDKYDWQVGYVYGKSDASYRVFNSIDFYHLGQETGQFACGADVISGCHVANFLNGYNTLNQADVNYLEYTSLRTSEIEQDYAYGSIGGPLYALPAGDLKGVIGFEQRQESGFDRPDQITIEGHADSNAAASQGGYRVSSGYGQLEIPLIKDFPFVKKLTATIDGRYDYYTNFGRALTWDAGLNYEITPDVRFRGNFNTGFRAPNVKELYGGTFQNFLTFAGDPCDTAGGGFAGSGTCNAALAKINVNPATYVSQLDQTANPQVANLSGGNVNLKPETTQQFNVGIVVTPQIVKNLSIEVDYYNILVRNQITSIDPGTLISECYGPQQLALACSQITRGGAGDITAVQSSEVNLGYEKTDGLDAQVDYAINSRDMYVPLPGRFIVSGQMSYLLHDDTLNPDGTIKQNAGTFDIATGAGEPRFKALASLTYAQDPFSFSYTARYYGGLKNVDQTTFVGGSGDYTGNEAPGVFFHDISASYHYGIFGVSVGIDNVTDKDPPLIFGDVSSANALSAAGYDFVGRFYYMKASVAF